MSKADIDTSVFKAHSVRGALTSKALSTQQIIDRANWAKARTFYRFFHRGHNHDDFQEKVLSLE
jgi:hypothetical protein